MSSDAILEHLLHARVLLCVVGAADVDDHATVLRSKVLSHAGTTRFRVVAVAADERLVVYFAHQMVLHVCSDVGHQTTELALVEGPPRRLPHLRGQWNRQQLPETLDRYCGLCSVAYGPVVSTSYLSFHFFVTCASELRVHPRMLQFDVLRDRRALHRMCVLTVGAPIRVVEQVRHDVVTHDGHFVRVIAAQTAFEDEIVFTEISI